METIVLPLLSSKITPRTPGELLDYLLAHALESDYSQSTLAHGRITSFAYLAAKYGNDPDRMVKETKEALERYLDPYFNMVIVNVAQAAIPGLPEKGSRYGITMSFSATAESGERVDLTEGFSVEGTVMSRIGKQE